MRKRDFPALLLYVLGFLLLWEWLRPIEQLTNTDNIEIFIIFLLLSFTLSYFKLKWIWQFAAKSIYILLFIQRLYYEGSFFQFSWLKSFITDLVHNVGWMFARDWNALSYEFRSFLFFILLWLMGYLIDYWLLRQQQIFLFFFMTLVYITVLDTFTDYDAKMAIVRTVIAGFAAIGMLSYYRITYREKVNSSPAFFKKWMAPLAGMIAFSVLLGVVSPKAAPIWPDPVPYLKAVKEGESKSSDKGVSRIGFGANDERLGGPFIGDNKTVFKVMATGKIYWKVETKDLYTGKGWVSSGLTPISFKEGDLVPVYSIPNGVERSLETAEIFPADTHHPLIVYPAGIVRIQGIKPNLPESTMFPIDTTTEKIESFRASEYSIEYGIPRYKVEDLRKTTGFQRSEMGQEFYQKYTKLPENLPSRIKQLTEEITAGEKNWFDQAKAVERYFGQSEYSYDQKNVALPGENDDYVDQFLFETKRGYCDNFSTSMAVMLRTIGIPTRWVKGFTGGDFLEYSKEADNKTVYNITNNHAHSWVEVFLPNQGWVPFEPTKGFANDIRIDYGTNESSSNRQYAPPAPALKKPKKETSDDTKQTKKAEEKKVDLDMLWLKTKLFFKTNWTWMVLSMAGLIAFIAILYRIRGRWFPYILLLRYRFKQQDETIATAYLILLGQLDRYGLKRKENQTLRNYAQYIDSFFSTKEMTRLTNQYEQYLYHQRLPKGSWQGNRKLWENLIKKTIA